MADNTLLFNQKKEEKMKLCNNKKTRNILWVAIGIAGIIGWWMGKDIIPLITLGSGLAVGLGVETHDDTQQ